ncbi:NAD(P)-binding protein [Streptomyces rimosus]|uniref:NAD(P)-binding protein n=1 Tax=Streptomyces rimosus TaxID=1927 RepID=UPI00131BC53B
MTLYGRHSHPTGGGPGGLVFAVSLRAVQRRDAAAVDRRRRAGGATAARRHRGRPRHRLRTQRVRPWLPARGHTQRVRSGPGGPRPRSRAPGPP